jgi:hypothetical protein
MLDQNDAGAQQRSDGFPSNQLAQIDDRYHCIAVSEDAGNMFGDVRKFVEAHIWQYFDDLRNIEAISLAANFEK